MAEKLKTVYRYDAGRRGFGKAATVLIGVASLLDKILVIKGEHMRISIEYCTQ